MKYTFEIIAEYILYNCMRIPTHYFVLLAKNALILQRAYVKNMSFFVLIFLYAWFNKLLFESMFCIALGLSFRVDSGHDAA